MLATQRGGGRLKKRRELFVESKIRWRREEESVREKLDTLADSRSGSEEIS